MPDHIQKSWSVGLKYPGRARWAAVGLIIVSDVRQLPMQMELLLGFTNPPLARSCTIRGTFGEHSGNIQGTFGEHSGNIQGTFSEHSVNIQ